MTVFFHGVCLFAKRTPDINFSHHIPASKAEILHHDQHIEYMTGFLTEPQDALKEADIGFVLSTDIETISFACREMMSAGLPVIVSDYGGLAENITAEVDGWVTPAGDTVALSHLLLNIITLSSAELLNMKKNARKKSEMEFGKEMMINKTHLIYKKVMTN